MINCKNCGRQLKPGDKAYQEKTHKLIMDDVKREARTETVFEFSCAPRCPR